MNGSIVLRIRWDKMGSYQFNLGLMRFRLDMSEMQIGYEGVLGESSSAEF